MRRIVLDAQYSVMTSALTMALKQGGPDFQVQNAGPKTKDITFVIPRKVRAAGMWQFLKLLLMRFPMQHFKSWRDGNGMVTACLWEVLPMWR